MPSAIARPPAITIGLPCYGRPAFLHEALTHLARQTFRDFIILVYENPSDADTIRDLVATFAASGLAIWHHRYDTNIGILANFVSVLEAAPSPYFIWAADDDLRHPEALTSLHAMLEADASRDLAVSSVEVINTESAGIDHHPGFSRFTTGPDGAASLLEFLAEPEICGKANMIYGLFRTAALRDAFAAIGNTMPAGWGPDLVLMTAFLARHRVIGTDRVLFRKRTNNSRISPLAKRFPQDFGWPVSEFSSLRAKILAAIPDGALRLKAGNVLDQRQRHLATLGGLRRGILKAFSLESSAPQRPERGDSWIDGAAA